MQMKAEEIAQAQLKETVEQDQKQVTVRAATVTCPCGVEKALTLSFKCLYCRVWFCEQCAEKHFGKTVADYHKEKTHD